MSGAPMWQIKKKMTQYEQERQKMVDDYIAQHEEKSKPAEAPWVLVDAVPQGERPKGQKPLVFHVLVKDLNKVAKMKGAELPTSGIFQNKAPMGLYAVFDGQSCAGAAGHTAAEFCARNFHIKMLANLTMLQPAAQAATDTYVKAAMIKSFHDLDAEYLAQHRDVHHGCGAAVAHVFVAVIGRCSAVLAEVENGKLKPVPFGLSQAKPSDASERMRLQRSGAVVVQNAGRACIRHPSGAMSPVSRSMGDPLWKGPAGGSAGPELVICTPEVTSVELKGHEVHQALLLLAANISENLSPEAIIETTGEFSLQPRLCCGEIGSQAFAGLKETDAKPQSVVAQICFLPPKEKDKAKAPDGKEQPPAKKAKVEVQKLSSVRLRHILVRHSDERPPAAAAAAKAAAAKRPAEAQSTRPRSEAEALLRKAMWDIRKDMKASGKTAKNASELVILQGKKFAELCRELSECPSAKKGGSMCGDMGWLSVEELTRMGGTFREKVEPLKPGQWSDVTPSDQGVHLIQRIA